MFKPQIAYKSKHGGYVKRPSKKQVNSLLNYYKEVNEINVNKIRLNKKDYIPL